MQRPCGGFGPKQPLFPQESQLIDKYLDEQGGKALLFLLDPETDPKLEELFAKWNIDLGSNVVVDVPAVMDDCVGTGPAVPLVVNYGGKSNHSQISTAP